MQNCIILHNASLLYLPKGSEDSNSVGDSTSLLALPQGPTQGHETAEYPPNRTWHQTV